MSLSYSSLSMHLPLCLLIRKMKWEWILKQCNNSDEGDKILVNIKKWTTIGHSSTQQDNQNRNFKINSAMILTFVFVYRNAAKVAGNIDNCVIICTNGVVMSWCIGRNKDKCNVNMYTTYDVPSHRKSLTYSQYTCLYFDRYTTT